MKIFTGKPVSPGYAEGRAVIIGAGRPAAPSVRIEPDQRDTEVARFHCALDAADRELSQLQARVESELGSAAAEIFSAHLLFLRDPQFIDRVEACIRTQELSLESAIQVTVDELAALLDQADNPYLRERSADIRDLHRRLLRHITRPADQLAELPPDSVLVARELLPSDLLEFDRRHLVGIITETGGETGHAAILARALGVPAVTGVAEATQLIGADMRVLVDGQTGEVVVEPDAERLHAALLEKQRYDALMRRAQDFEQRECRTRDGVRIQLLANIGRPFDVHQIAQHHLDGVGLFRTEYLFLDEAIAPSFERQRDIYGRIAASLGGRPLVIRTLDLGGDKWPAFLKPKFEANPNLGVRGLRFSLLAAEDLFRTQIRAALHAARGHDVRIMLPMVLGQADLQHALAIIQDVAAEEGFAGLPPVGALVETPAAVFAIDEILAACDFVSIGTNDLTQFILAADRNALAMMGEYTVLNPSVLRAVHRVLQAADASGKPAAVCGEAAADPAVACLLIGLGARSLSMSPVSAARVRCAVRASHHRALEELADAALGSGSAQAVSALISEALQSVLEQLGATALSA